MGDIHVDTYTLMMNLSIIELFIIDLRVCVCVRVCLRSGTMVWMD